MERKYQYTIAQLIDRLCIVTLKSIKLNDKAAYEKEAKDIMDDLDLLIGENQGRMIRAIQLNSIANEIVWTNESNARVGGDKQDKMLKLTHSVNGVRTMAMNAISSVTGERKDLKLDCLAAELCKMNGYDFEGIIL